MSGIRVVIHLVRCTQSLLICDDLKTDHLRFRDAAHCQAQLPILIEAARRQGPPTSVVMGRCRFMPEPYVPPANGAAGPPSG
jgi:hypothetical protein